MNITLKTFLLFFLSFSLVATASNSKKETQKYINLGKYAAEFKDYKRAINHYQNALKESPRSKPVLFSLVALYQKINDYENAEKISKSIVEYYPLDAEAHLILGNIYLIKNKLGSAIKEFKEVVHIDRENATGFRNLGYAELSAGAGHSAVKSLKQAEKLDPNDATILFDLGLAYGLTDDKKKAVKTFRKALNLRNDADGKIAYTDFLFSCVKEKFKDAKADYKSNNFDRAERKFKKIADEFPDFPLTYAYLGHLNFHQKPPQFAKAAAAYSKALLAKKYTIIKPKEYVFILDNLGMIYLKSGNFDEAESLFKKAVELQTDYPVPYFNYGCMLARRELFDPASVSFADAVRRDENFLNYIKNHAGLEQFRASGAYTNLLNSF